MSSVRELNERVLKHIGLASTKEKRARKLNEDAENNRSGRVMKKRKKGERPQYSYQSGDKIGRKCFFEALKYFGIYSDSVTLERDWDESEDTSNKNERTNEGKPRNMAVMMVLNEVAESSMNGGGAREKSHAKRGKPHFFLVSDNRPDCLKVLTAFKEIFSRNENENKNKKIIMIWFG